MTDIGRKRVRRTHRAGLSALLTAGAVIAATWAAALLLGAGWASATEPVERSAEPQVQPLASGPRDAIVETQGREGARQRFLLRVPPSPRAVVVLIPGGGGVVGIRPDGSLRHTDNFVVRTRELYLQKGLAVALLDLPTDQRTLRGGFRTTRAHVLDLKSVIAFLRERLGVPVWLMGTSRGTVSATYVASQLTGRGGPDGLVLSASVVVGRKDTVYQADLAAIRVPTLLVHHRDDACKVTPYSGAAKLLAALANAQPRELLTVEGGGPPRGEACRALHYHGFIGSERDAVERIVGWIDARLADQG